MNQRLFGFVLTPLLLAACISATVTPPTLVATLRPAALPNEAGVPQGTVMPAPTAVINPETIESLPSPTPLHGPTTITVKDLQTGQTLYLAVGDTFTFDSSITGPIHVGDERIVARLRGTERVYAAIAPGQTELQVMHDLCAGAPGCMAPVGLFILKIVVQ